ncbi:hypothetical protein GCM10027613_50060 [Microlunatus endophyticus]
MLSATTAEPSKRSTTVETENGSAMITAWPAEAASTETPVWVRIVAPPTTVSPGIVITVAVVAASQARALIRSVGS